MNKSPFKHKEKPKIPELEGVNDKITQWFEKRGISKDIIDLAGVESGEAFING